MNWYQELESPSTVSFDFDCTLTMPHWSWEDQVWRGGMEPNWDNIQRMTKYHEAGHRIVVVTSRNEEAEKTHDQDNGRISVADFIAKYKLPVDEIYFTSGDDKGPQLAEIGAVIHHDDFQPDIESAEEHGIQAVKIPHPDDKNELV